jgi:SAM-dependent methyltransferase
MLVGMTENRPEHRSGHGHDYLPAAGRDAFLPFYDLLTRLMRMNRTYDRLIAQAELRTGMRVLEIGCGTGNVTIRAKRAHPGADFVGSDPDPLVLGRARRKAAGLDGVRFEHGYAQSLPYGDGEFDRVLSSAMLHHLDVAAKPLALAEVFRVLRPGGQLHLVDFVGGHRGLLGRLMPRSGHGTVDFDGDVPDMMRSAGFDCTVADVQRTAFFGPLTFFRATRMTDATADDGVSLAPHD